MQATMPAPNDLLACKSWKNRCALLHARAEEGLRETLKIGPRADLDRALLTLGQASGQQRSSIKRWQQAEEELDQAIQLYELAIELHQRLQMDANFRSLEC
jgi:hypothetical protein